MTTIFSDSPQSELLSALRAVVGERGLLQGGDMVAYETGARYGQGRALCVVRPASTDEVSKVVALCASRRVRLIPQGANTGLVGASTPDASGQQVLLSLGRLNRECRIDVDNRSVEVGAGVLLQDLNQRLEEAGLWFPIDLGANPSIGGMVAANTGGTRLIRYGDVRHNLLALEAVLFNPPGQVVRLGRALRKDNTGADLKQLLVGSSGSFGVITQATLEVHRRPQQSATALVVPTSDEAVMRLLLRLERELGDFLSAFEGIGANALRAAVAHVPNLRNPFAPEPVPDYAVLIELESSASPSHTGLDLQAALNAFLEEAFETDVSNAVIGSGEELWAIRHAISEGARHLGQLIAFDVSVPRSRIMAFCAEARALVATKYPGLVAVDFGHIADGGVHFNVAWPETAPTRADPANVRALRDDLYALAVDTHQGSFSAEHGIGPHNQAWYTRYTAAPVKHLAAAIQTLVDPERLCGAVDFGE